MLYFKFKNYEEFKELFEVRTTNNGKNVRINGILLSFYKNCIRSHNYKPLNRINNLTRLYNYYIRRLKDFDFEHRIQVGEDVFTSNIYRTDGYVGLCEDGDESSIRYVLVETDRVYKMKAGKFLRKLLIEHGFDKELGEQAMNYICETFSNEWRSYAETRCGGYELKVTDNFREIYNSSNHAGSQDFGSCMTNNCQYTFYEYSVDAKAASIWKDDEMYARCVIFNNVKDENGNLWRLAERQYSAGGNEQYKQILVNMLINGGYIDGYKKIGAACSAANAFIANDGSDLSDKEFCIPCRLEADDTLSYQDSFKWYNSNYHVAYNYEPDDYTHKLDITDSRLEGTDYDEYHERYCDRAVNVNVWNNYFQRYDSSTCDEEDLDDFYIYNGEYYNECEYCEVTGMYIPRSVATYCEYEDCYVEDCYAVWFDPADSYFSSEQAIDDWKDEHWSKCSDCDEYIEEKGRELIQVHEWCSWRHDYDLKDVCSHCLEENGYFLYDGEWYDEVNEDGIPYHLVEQLDEVTA